MMFPMRYQVKHQAFIPGLRLLKKLQRYADPPVTVGDSLVYLKFR
jgi:hypothetical protein